MLRLIKQILKKPNKPETITIKEDEFEDWLSKEIEKKKKDFEKKAKETNEDIKRINNNMLELLNDLEAKGLHNENIPTKEKNYMEGNRVTFAKNIRNFLKQIPTFSDYKSFTENLERTNTELLNLNKSNQRPYGILQHFFANETKVISGKLKEISEKLSNLENYYKETGLESLTKAKENILEQKKQKETKENIAKDLKEKNKRIEELEKEYKRIEKKIQVIEKKDEYLKVLKIGKEKDVKVKELKEEKNKLGNLFSNLSQPLKKNQRICLEEKLNKDLLASPAETILENETKTIIEFLGKLKENVEKEKIELKTKKKEKSLQTIQSIDEKTIEDFKKSISELKNKRKRLETELRHSHIMTEHSDFVYKKEHLKEKIKNKKEQVKSIQNKLDNPNQELSIKEILERLNNDLSNKDIILEE
ncbi:MAG: hypothetical protein ACQESF_07135 [Nanobdellota archaeon]